LGAGAGVIFIRVFLTFRRTSIFAVYINCFTGVKQEQESIILINQESLPEQESIFEAQEWSRSGKN